jgi:hypothetical protein
MDTNNSPLEEEKGPALGSKRKFDEMDFSNYEIDPSFNDSFSPPSILRTCEASSYMKRSALKPLINDSGTTQAQSYLCLRCESIDLKDAFAIPPGPQGRPIVFLGHITDDMKESDCALCRLFFATHMPVARTSLFYRKGYHLRAFNNYAISSRRLKKSSIPTDLAVVLAVTPGRCRKGLWKTDRSLCVAHGLIAPLSSSPSPSRVFQARSVDPATINFGQIREWLGHCDKFHRKSCTLMGFSRPALVRCIDCLTRRIIQIPENEDYVALSYVWGDSKRSLHERTSDGAEQNVLPTDGVSQVIEDAIIAVRKLRARFLWVDKYCINQNDPLEKHSQIQSMNKIYEGAFVTIVAAAGINADSGLSGLSSPRRISQPIALIGNELFVSTMKRISFPIQSSAWITRGWTYQEAVLSRRCLFFTDEQVYFVCKQMTCCEAIHSLPNPKAATATEFAMLNTGMFDADLKDLSYERKGLWRFYEHLFQYKKRQLTFDSDSLNAFRGILAKSPYKSVWGRVSQLR